MPPTLQHPDRYVWDFWYYFEPATEFFHVFYLNADPELVSKGLHHDASTVGYGRTRDFSHMEWGRHDVLSASPDRWDNTSIWSGDVVRIQNGFLMFYTSRNRDADDGMTQNIGAAFAEKIDAELWTPIPDFRIRPEPSMYAERHIPEDISTHAWRDPYLFLCDNHPHMILSAKSVHQPLGRNGCVALLRSRDGGLLDWEVLGPVCNPGHFSEMEVAQVYRNPNSGYELVFSCAAALDFSPSTKGRGGLLGIPSQDIHYSNGDDAHVLLPFNAGLYACRILPELDGEIMGFDRETGGIRKSGVKTGWQSLHRDFTSFSIPLNR